MHGPELRKKTVPGILLEKVQRTPSDVAFRAKKLGIYRERTWADVHGKIARCAVGLAQLGLGHGDRLALIGDPCEEYTICELAAQCMGAITYGAYATSSAGELEHVVRDGRAKVLVAGNQEYLDRVLSLTENLPDLKKLIIIDTRGTFGYEHPDLTSYEKVVESGAEQLASDPGLFDAMVKRVRPADGLFIVYTSGTMGTPKGVLISHGKHLAAVSALLDRYPLLLDGPHRTVVYLPLCTIVGKMIALTLPLLAPVVPHYGEDVENPGQTFFEVAPTVLFTVPNYLKRLGSSILVGIENSTPLKRLVFSVASAVGRQYLRTVWEGKREVLVRLAYLACYSAVFRPVLNKMGLDQVKIALSTGAPLSPQLMTMWQVFGLNLSETYGLSETGGGIVATQEQHFPKPGNVGTPLACYEVMLSGTGEILVKGEELCECYWDNPDLTGVFRDQEGWLRTEDAGEWTPDGRLRIKDRLGEEVHHKDGKRMSLTAIESALRSSPYINEAIVVGHHRPYLSCLIEIDFDAVSDWARRNNISVTGFASLIQHPEVMQQIGKEVERINRELKPEEQIEAFRILPTELTPAEEEAVVTPTRKIRRKAVHKKFEELIESMYKEDRPAGKGFTG